jgi:hypothetical protein
MPERGDAGPGPFPARWQVFLRRLAIAGAIEGALGLTIYLGLFASDVVPNEEPEFYRFQLLHVGLALLALVALVGMAWAAHALDRRA